VIVSQLRPSGRAAQVRRVFRAVPDDRLRELKSRSCQDGETQVLVTVKDRGVGISAENSDRLFGAFFTTKPSGTGMGPWIGRSIIEAHGGRLWAESISPHGAAFHFTLPFHQDKHY
jgi:signal transduction histidine kinase